MTEINKPRIVIAAPKSGSGKTLITIGIMKALSERGKNVASFKCGPDYIDPMFHKKVLNIPSKNLDLFFTEEEKTRELFLQKNESDISVIEGVMGLYDGLAGISDRASTYHLASCLRVPIILIVDAKGMGLSVMAEIAGFLSMDKDRLISGIILNRMGKSYYESLKPVLEEKFNIPILGAFPNNKDISIESRHLGLCLPDEIKGIEEKVMLAGKMVEENIDLDRLVKIAYSAEPLKNIFQNEVTLKPINKTIAVARDDAFCFIYEDNINFLKKQGINIVYFSPLKDTKLPENIDGIILYGGYPELYAKSLSQNETMKASVKSFIDNGGLFLAECGGFMYLHESIITKEGEEFSMVGAIKGKCFYTGKLVRFGYAEFKNEAGAIRGHEFHYYDSDNNGEDMEASKPVTGKSWKCSFYGKNYIAGFPHLYYESNPEFIRKILESDN